MAAELLQRLSTGILGLDEVLYGGLIPGRAYMARGGPGTGKTTLGLHFLTAGDVNANRPLFITLGEPEAQIRQNAEAVGFQLTHLTFLDLSPASTFFTEAENYDIFAPAEVEREPITREIIEMVTSLTPQRVFLDAITQFRYLSADDLQFRRQTISFLRFLIERDATVLFTSESSAGTPDDDLQFIADGVLQLDASPKGRAIRVTKFRGSDFHSGLHAMK